MSHMRTTHLVGLLMLVGSMGVFPAAGVAQSRPSAECLIGAGLSQLRAAILSRGYGQNAVARAILSGQKAAVIAMLSCGGEWNEQTLNNLEDLARDAGEKNVARSIDAWRKWKGK